VRGQREAVTARTRASLLVPLLLAVFVSVPPSVARADGDPASDVLLSQSVFLPADAATPVPAQLRLLSLLHAASRAGLPIRVAVISRPADLGGVSELWDQPHAYARFLGMELSLNGRARLLVVMPNGVGFYWPGNSATAIDGLVSRIPVGRSGSALIGAAEVAVMSVADAAHVRLASQGRATGAGTRAPRLWRPTTHRLFGLAVIAALAGMACAVGTIARWRFSSGRSP
jgi:hypothetical protein